MHEIVGNDDFNHVSVRGEMFLARFQLGCADGTSDAIPGLDELINDMGPEVAVDSGCLNESKSDI